MSTTAVRETSIDALRAAPSREGEVLRALTVAPLTDWELHEKLGAPYSAIQRPRGDLVRLGIVQDSGKRRPTAYGRNAIVWELA